MGIIVLWSELPDNMLTVISDKLMCNIKGYTRFGAVCRSWQSVYIKNRHLIPSRKLPMLMLPTELNVNSNDTRSFYSLTKKKVCNSQVLVPRNLICRGSSHGWLVTLCRMYHEVRLFNPFMPVNNLIKLPHLSALEPGSNFYISYDFLYKVILSANPASNPLNSKVMAIYGSYRQLAYLVPGHSEWTLLPSAKQVEDVIYYRDQFYTVDESGEVIAWDLNPIPKASTRISTIVRQEGAKRYLVELFAIELFGDLWQVLRVPDDEDNRFSFFKLDSVGSKWIEMNNLRGCALFLGDNYSLSVSASDYPECKANSVYFTDDGYYEQDLDEDYAYMRHPLHMGIYSLADHTVEPLYPNQPEIVIPIPIWIEPIW